MACSDKATADNWDFSYVKPTLDDITQLIEIDSPNDPEDLPFKSKYAAREKFEFLKKKFDSFIESHGNVDSEDHEPAISLEDINLTADGSNDLTDVNNTNGDKADGGTAVASVTAKQQVLGSRSPCSNIDRVELFLKYIEGRLGANYIDCEETSSGEDHLNQALQKLVSKFDTSSSWAAYIHMYLLNQLGILHAARRNNDKALQCLHEAEATSEVYKSKHSEAPLCPTDLLAPFHGKHFLWLYYYYSRLYLKLKGGN